MEHFDFIASIVEYATSTKKNGRIVGGMLLSLSLFFGGLAFTFMTSSSIEEDSNE